MKKPNIPSPSWIDMRGSVPPGTTVCDILEKGIPDEHGIFPGRPPTGEEYLAFIEQHAKPFPMDIDDDE